MVRFAKIRGPSRKLLIQKRCDAYAGSCERVLAGTRPVIACFQGAQAPAQVGPIEPVIITGGKPSKALVEIPDLKEDCLASVQVTVAADGSASDVVVSPSSGNADADAVAIRFMKEKQFLPALDSNAQPVEAKVMGSVEVHSKSINKQIR